MTLNSGFQLCSGILCIITFISLVMFIYFMVKKQFLVGIILISSAIILILIQCIFNLKDRLEIIKDISNNKIIVNRKNIFSRVVKKITISKDNIHFYCTNYSNYIEETNYFFIINNFKDLYDIDLNTSEIKLKPAVLFYSLKNYIPKIDLKSLYDFLGCKLYENPFFFDVDYYMKNNLKYPHPYGSLKRLMKINSHFLTYFYILPNHNALKTDIISRIDFIYSKNYEELFIGLVNLKNTSYVNTFDIDLTKVDEITSIDEPRRFAIVFSLKNGEKINIYGFTRIEQINKDDLLFLLKENFKPK